jgi:tetratricopeptide (TPR) repeat protein
METKKFKEALKYIETACNLFKETEFEFLLYFMKIGVLIKLEDFQKAAETIDLIYDIVPDNRPKYKIALMRIEGKSYSEAYDIIYEQVEKFTEDPRSGA